MYLASALKTPVQPWIDLKILIPLLIKHQSTTELTLQRATKMLVKVEPCDSGGSFEAAIVPRIRQALQEPSRLQVVVSCML